MNLGVPFPLLLYIDPGTGSYLFQIAIGGVLAVVYGVRMYWSRLKDRVRRLFPL